MVPCPKCGTPQSPDVRRCRACGQELGVAPTADLEAPGLGKTQVTDATKAQASERPAAEAQGGGFKKTMLGMPSHAPPGLGPKPDGSQAPPASSEADAQAKRPINKTMIGVAPIAAPPRASQPPPSETSSETGGGFKKTMLGVAPPSVIQQRMGQAPPAAAEQPPATATQGPDKGLGSTQVHPSPATGDKPPANFSPAGTLPLSEGRAAAQVPNQASAPGQPPSNAQTLAAPAAVSGSNQKTMLGIAVPGIAPIHPGQSKAAPSAPPAPSPSLPPPSQMPMTEQKPGSRSVLYGILVAIFLALVVTTLGAFYLLSSPYTVAAKVVIDESGQELLEVSCEECPDGTTSEIDGQMTTFKGGTARVALKDPLKVGNNSLTVSLLKPGDKHAETLELTVPVQFRVRGDLSELNSDPPALRVSIQAIPGTRVVMDGNALKLDAGGSGEYTLDISKELSGEAATIATLERKIPYTITPPEGTTEQGEVMMRANITPLTLEAPGPSIVIDKANFMLAGQTQPGGSVSVAGRAITVDPSGRFAQLMSVSSAGETTINVRASQKDQAPRLVPIKIRRVESLAEEAKRLQGVARTPFGDFAANVDKSKGSQVLFDAQVMESRIDSHTTIILANVTSGCTNDPCLVRVLYGSKLTLKKDAPVTVSAVVAGTVDGPRSGTTMPELKADFVVSRNN